VSLKSRGRARQCENLREKQPRPHFPSDAIHGILKNSSTSARSYALYRPRPGRNVSPAKTGSKISKHGEEEVKETHRHQVCEESAICPPASELTFIYNNIDEVRIISLVSSTFIQTRLTCLGFSGVCRRLQCFSGFLCKCACVYFILFCI